MATAFALDGFEPIKRIGGGGFGDVWLTRQTNVDREVAVKVGHAPIQDEIIRLRFERECKALGRLSGHPNIVDVYTAGSLDDGRPYLVLEYVDGGTLWHQLKKRQLEEDELIILGEQLAGALHQAHTQGVLHRDLKPENILMRSNGEVVLGDFGIARLQDGANTTSAAITASVAYAAPEVLGGTRASVASDLYGVGICLLAAILRSVPFVRKTDDSIHPIISRVMSEKAPDTRSKGISEEMAVIVESLLKKDPAARPQSAAEVHEMFHQLRYRSGGGIGRQDAGSLAMTGRTAISPRLSQQPLTQAPVQPSPQPGAGNTDVAASRNGLGTALADERSPSSEGPAISQPNRVSSESADGVASESGPFGRQLKDHDGTGAPSNVRAFTVAYLATLAIGALLIFILAQILG